MFKNKLQLSLLLTIVFVISIISATAVVAFFQSAETVSATVVKNWVLELLIRDTGFAVRGNADQQYFNSPDAMEMYNKSGASVNAGAPVILYTTSHVIAALQNDNDGAALTLTSTLSTEEGYFGIVLEVDSLGRSTTTAIRDTGAVAFYGLDHLGNDFTETLTITSYDANGQDMGYTDLQWTSHKLWTQIDSVVVTDLTSNAACSVKVDAYYFGAVNTTTTASDPLIFGVTDAAIADEAAGNVKLLGLIGSVAVDSAELINPGDYLGQSAVAGHAHKVTDADSAFAIAMFVHRRGDTRSIIPAMLLNLQDAFQNRLDDTITATGAWTWSAEQTFQDDLVIEDTLRVGWPRIEGTGAIGQVAFDDSTRKAVYVAGVSNLDYVFVSRWGDVYTDSLSFAANAIADTVFITANVANSDTVLYLIFKGERQ